ncbi:MAG: RHS repeat-associated core domain-containing protein, partial [Sedimentisphaerales bacterium]|nr:RHS repeat-associated core domain-containing protein [Sedimentisphaerales bacterium]
ITSSLTYNWDGKLRSAGAGQATVDCLYDPDGNRIYREVDDESTTKRKYIVDTEADLPVVLLEIDPDIGDPNDSVVKTYLYANEQIIAQHDGYWGQDVYFYLHDRLGSVRQMIDNQANVKNTYTYEPFGTPFASEVTENVSNPWTYTGQYYDSEIAQYYLRARQYDPALYCFGSRDPEEGGFMESLTLHRYLYCMNDPINQMDLTGRAPTNTQETASTVGTQAAVGTAGAAGTNYQTILERIQNFANFESFRNKALEFASQSTQGVWNWARTVGRDVHHIVARGWGNVDKFGREVLNSFDNLISLPRGMHQQITQFFNQGARYHDFLKGYSGSLQNVISELPYAEQLDWGLAAMDYILTNGSMAEFNPIMYGLSLPVQ